MLDNRIKNNLVRIFEKYDSVEKVVLFGSRARGDNTEISDIDLCLFGKVNHRDFSYITMEIDEINTCLKFDILVFNKLSKEELIKNISREGVVIYSGKEV